jgi:hypothetical protein
LVCWDPFPVSSVNIRRTGSFTESAPLLLSSLQKEWTQRAGRSNCIEDMEQNASYDEPSNESARAVGAPTISNRPHN